ncbi:glycine cleavage T [Micractinium conductrix]|uniref:Aminomethyltransferase n=1 Tax=Micractinium conductrix TaxID=554055 RepID=A0A2P6VRY3_9CHLO|nr:glycine cleavage T [Micractinium conductrix]|eukprot:PSC76849.1 glycine cleavage T [Micractinium conductrix]
MRRGAVQLLARALGAGEALLPAGAAGRLSQPAGGAAAMLARRGIADDSALLKTPLYDYHVANGAKMVPFAGWSMPIQYKDSIIDSTLHCRSHASLFDVSHMCGLTLKGKDAIPFLESLVVGDIAALADGTGTLSVFTNEKGGIIDDTVVTKVTDSELYIVVNAGCREKDLAHIGKHLDAWKAKGKDVGMILHDDRSLLALQGPEAAAVLQQFVKQDLDKVYFSNFLKLDIKGIPCFLTRTGYTGEDGFELSIPNASTVELADALNSDERVRLCGLGPRDSLRLEAGLCLYGNDLNEDITPIEAGLTWTIGKRRREACDFLGGQTIKQQLADGVSIRRVGFITTGAPARQGVEILSADGEKKVGTITSGAFSPCLKKNISMGYVDKSVAKAGTALKVNVRGKINDAAVTKMPFVPTHYHKPAQ